uniref:Uncharacterized protein n=1 Tax=Arundo donax TaxID=35708 RepID=A0A0A9BH09_ARUDO
MHEGLKKRLIFAQAVRMRNKSLKHCSLKHYINRIPVLQERKYHSFHV